MSLAKAVTQYEKAQINIDAGESAKQAALDEIKEVTKNWKLPCLLYGDNGEPYLLSKRPPRPTLPGYIILERLTVPQGVSPLVRDESIL